MFRLLTLRSFRSTSTIFLPSSNISFQKAHFARKQAFKVSKLDLPLIPKHIQDLKLGKRLELDIACAALKRIYEATIKGEDHKSIQYFNEVLKESEETHKKLDFTTFEIIFNFFGYLRNKEKVKEYAEKLDHAEVMITQGTIESLLLACARTGQLDLVQEKLKYLFERDFTPSSSTFSMLVSAYLDLNEESKALAVGEYMQVKNIQYDLAFYKKWIQYLGGQSRLDEMNAKFEEAKKKHTLDPIIYILMIKAYADSNRIERALQLFNEQTKLYKIEPSIHSVTPLISAFARTGDYDSVEFLLEELKKKGIEMDLRAYNSLIAAVGKSGYLELVERAYSRLKSKFKPNKYTYTTLFSIYAKHGAVDKMKQLALEYDGDDPVVLKVINSRRLLL